jgi:hypothetical protein
VLLVLGVSNATGYQEDKSTDYRTDPDILAWDGRDFVPYAPNSVTGLLWGQSNGSWAAELAYAQDWRAANPLRRLVILRWTAPATRVAPDTPDHNWDWHPASTGELFDASGTDWRAAMEAIRTRFGEPRIRLVWLQFGEGDTGKDVASQYQANFTALVDALRDPARRYAIPAGTPIAITRLGAGIAAKLPETTPVIRDAQKAVAALDRGGPAILVDTDDLAVDPDILHLSKAGQLSLGHRLWRIDQGSYVEP